MIVMLLINWRMGRWDKQVGEYFFFIRDITRCDLLLETNARKDTRVERKNLASNDGSLYLYRLLKFSFWSFFKKFHQQVEFLENLQLDKD